jgi:hypothetical protein
MADPSDSDTQGMSAVRAGKVRPSTVAICCNTGLLQNHLALINRGRAMMRLANIPKNIRYKVFPMVFETATLLDSLVMCTIDGETKTCAEHFGKTLPKFAKYLRT